MLLPNCSGAVTKCEVVPDFSLENFIYFLNEYDFISGKVVKI
jgi:hypothetical protein